MLELHGAMNLSSLILNDIEKTLKMKHTQVENTTEEETIIATTGHVIYKTLGNIF